MIAKPCISFSLPQDCQLLVVIVNYQSAHLTIDCLQSLEPEVQSISNVRVVIVENNSGDDSVEKIQQAIQLKEWNDWATVLISEYNGGYAYGNNLAIRPALEDVNSPEFILLLNPDTRIFPGALQSLLSFMSTHPEVGIGGSSFVEADGSPFSLTFRFPSVFSQLDDGLRLGFVTRLLRRWVVARQMTNIPESTDWLPGASLIVRSKVFKDIGLMDEGYFLYFEETDFCLQARRAGWSCWYIPESKVMHIAGQSTGVTARNVQPRRLPDYWFNSRRRYFLKNHGFWYTLLVDTVWIVGFAIWRVRRVIQRKPDLDPPFMLQDFIRNSVFYKGSKIPDFTEQHS